jgi:hypothetical protein
MTTVKKFTTPIAAGAEVDARAQRYLTDHQGATYQEALAVVLHSAKALAQAYAEPAQRAKRVPAAPTPAVPVTGADEREIFDWIMRALGDGKAGSLPGALGELSIEAARFMKVGMPLEEAARRAMGSFPHLVTLAKRGELFARIPKSWSNDDVIIGPIASDLAALISWRRWPDCPVGKRDIAENLIHHILAQDSSGGREAA